MIPSAAEPGTTQHATPAVLSADAILRATLLGILVLIAAHIGTHFLELGTELPGRSQLVRFFDLANEKNVPTFASGLLLLGAACLLFVTARVERRAGRTGRPWAFLGVLFLFLTIDEVIGIHELISAGLRVRFQSGGAVPRPLWVIPYGLAVVLLGGSFLRLVRRLPRLLLARIVVAGVIFLTGAVGFEVGEAVWAERYGLDERFFFVTALEEGCEMVGVWLLCRALLFHLRSEGGVAFVLAPPEREARQN